jgi:hypothetical protein
MRRDAQQAIIEAVGDREFVVRYEPISRLSDEPRQGRTDADTSAAVALLVDRCDSGLAN